MKKFKKEKSENNEDAYFIRKARQKIARGKASASMARSVKAGVKEVIGTCLSLGVTVEGKNAKLASKDVDDGVFDKKLKE